MSEPQAPWWRTVLSTRMLLCLMMGFSSGMPLYVLYQLVPAWLRDQGVDLETIGLFALVGIPYTWKFLWSPVLDRFVPPGLGRRRGWALITQVALLAVLAAFSAVDPVHNVQAVAFVALLVAFFSASQDIVLDAYRRELLPDRELGLGNAMFVNAYRVSSLVPGGLALILADHVPWSQVHLTVAAFMGVGILTTLFAPDVATEVAPPKSLREAVIGPLQELLSRGGRQMLLMVLFLFFYKLGDSMATALITPFYQDVGFTLTQIGTTAKLVGLWSTVVGAFLGGLIITRIGIHRSLWVFGVVQMLSILGFAALSEIGPNEMALGAAVAFEYLGIGLGTAAFVAFMQRATDKRFTATQYALFSSLIALPRTFANATTGWLAAQLGWTGFFLLCTALAVPGMLLLTRVAPWNEEPAPG